MGIEANKDLCRRFESSFQPSQPPRRIMCRELGVGKVIRPMFSTDLQAFPYRLILRLVVSRQREWMGLGSFVGRLHSWRGFSTHGKARCRPSLRRPMRAASYMPGAAALPRFVPDPW